MLSSGNFGCIVAGADFDWYIPSLSKSESGISALDDTSSRAERHLRSSSPALPCDSCHTRGIGPGSEVEVESCGGVIVACVSTAICLSKGSN